MGRIIEHQLTDARVKDSFGMLPLNRHKQSLAETQEHRQIAAILDDFGPAAFFTRQLAERRDDRRQQLDDDRRADIGHDAQSADRTMLQGAAGKQAVHAQHPAGAGGILREKIR